MKRPSADDLFLAAQWLDIYEGAEDAEACKRVAAWLNEQAAAAELRATARAHRVPVSLLRAKLSAA